MAPRRSRIGRLWGTPQGPLPGGRRGPGGAPHGARGADLGTRRLPAGTGKGCPRLARRPRTWFCAWQLVTQLVGGFATSVASSPVTKPIRPPLATSQIDTPPQCRTLGVSGVLVLQPGCTTRVATWALSRATNRDDRSLAMFTRAATWT